MNVIKIFIVNKIAYLPETDTSIICSNNSYQIKFVFDDEWSEFEAKTARFIFNDTVIDIPFAGDTVNVPPIANATQVKVGVFAGYLYTTTSASIPCIKSVRCEGGDPIDPPTPEVYDQIMDLFRQLKGEPGPEDPKGDAYILQEKDKVEIAAIVSEEKFSDLEAALDAIIAIQESLLPLTLTIDDQYTHSGSITITFIKGMTWSEWVASEYNTVGAITVNNEYTGAEQPMILGSCIRGGEWSLTVMGADVMDANSNYLLAGG